MPVVTMHKPLAAGVVNCVFPPEETTKRFEPAVLLPANAPVKAVGPPTQAAPVPYSSKAVPPVVARPKMVKLKLQTETLVVPETVTRAVVAAELTLITADCLLKFGFWQGSGELLLAV